MISVFKTNVTNATELQKIKPFLDIHLKNVKWNFDLEDCDNILRIECSKIVAKTTIKLL